MSVKKKPLVVVTRKLPDSIETRMRELFDARLNLDDTPMTPEQIAEAVHTADVLEIPAFPGFQLSPLDDRRKVSGASWSKAFRPL